MKTLVYSTHGFDKPFMETITGIAHELVFTNKPLSAETTDLAIGCEAVSLFTGDLAKGEVLHALKNKGVRFIALRSVGYDHVDLALAHDLGIRVANVPAYSPNAIAEHAVALLMAINRKLFTAQQLMAENDFRLDELVGFDLFGKTVGLVGTGKIGAAFARIMKGFGCNLLATDPFPDDQLIAETGIRYVPLETLCGEAAVIAVHCPLTPETSHLFNERTFQLMKPGVIFINTARGGIVNTEHLLQAIDSGIVAAAGLDVYEFEKPIYFKDLRDQSIPDPLFSRLRNHPKVILTGHQAFLTKEALEGIATTTRNNLSAWEKDSISPNDLSI